MTCRLEKAEKRGLRCPLFFVVLSIFLLAYGHAANAKRIALVIGNDNYQFVGKLEKAGNDAVAMGRELTAAGFSVRVEKNVPYRTLIKAVNSFASGIEKGDEVVFFYAGHGVQIKAGSYILPVDIEAESEAEVEKTALALDELISILGEAQAAYALVIVDACRDNPLKSRSRSFSGTRGLTPVEPVKGQLVVYSAARGQQALDRLSSSDKNPNGIFTREFIARMRQPGIRIQELARDVQEAVEGLAKSVDHEQRPAIYDESRGDFYFYPPRPGATASNQKDEGREDDFWRDTKEAGNSEAFSAYLEKYPAGRYVALAKANISRLSGAKSVSGAARQAIVDELSDWNAAKKSGNRDSYGRYLEKYPNGYFSSLASDLIRVIDREQRMAALESGDKADREQAAREKGEIRTSKAEIDKEESARRKLVSSLLKIDAPTF